MPNRILKESICTSEEIDALSWFEEVFFYRLIVNCDDFGRADGRIPILKSRLFPLKEIPQKNIQNALNNLLISGLIILYEYENRPYIQITKWEKHQTVRNKRSKFPPIPSKKDETCKQLKSIEINRKQMQANVPVIQSNPIQSEYESNPIKNKQKECLENSFNEFWSLYPRKVGKQSALKVWKKIKPDDVLCDEILKAVEKGKSTEQWNKNNGAFIPHPTTWLNRGGWEDEYNTFDTDCPL